MARSIKLGDKLVSSESRPYIIAEIGVNHEGSIDQAKKLIDLAKLGGADAAKFQSYKAGSLASKNSPSYWDTEKEPTVSQYELFKKYDRFTPRDYMALADHCNRCGIDFISTPFDDEAIEFLDPLVPFFKIASADLTNIPFLRKVAKKGKPIVMSTGASTLAEIDTAVLELEHAGCEDLVLLHCILNYPTSNEKANLRMIKGLKHAYPKSIIGYSDHTLPDTTMTSMISAYLLGAVVLEKHFTHDKTLPGNDHYHAMDKKDLSQLTKILDTIEDLLGKSDHKAPITSETISRVNARRSLVLSENVNVGDKLSLKNLTYKRPGIGISPSHWDEIIGRRLRKSLPEDHILQWADLE